MACDLQATSTCGMGARRWGLDGGKKGRHWQPAAIKKECGGPPRGEEMEGRMGVAK
jgi:hypothetical protein